MASPIARMPGATPDDKGLSAILVGKQTTAAPAGKADDHRVTSDSQWPLAAEVQHGPAQGLSRSSSLNSERRTSLSGRSPSERCLSRAASIREQANNSRRSSLETLHENDRAPQFEQLQRTLPALRPQDSSGDPTKKLQVRRHSSLRHQASPSGEEPAVPNLLYRALSNSASESALTASKERPKSHPLSRSPFPGAQQDDANPSRSQQSGSIGANDPWQLPSLLSSMPQTPQPAHSTLTPRPSSSLKRFSSLDQFMTYREDRESWKRESYLSTRHHSAAAAATPDETPATSPVVREGVRPPSPVDKIAGSVEGRDHTLSDSAEQRNKFRHVAAEVGFCFTIAMTQFLAEYLISGFAIVLPSLFKANSSDSLDATGLFWPAALLSLILSAFLLVFARVSDMYGGYGPFIFGLIWLAIWTLVPGFVSSSLLLNVSRAMQGFAIAAFTPSTFAMVGSIYPEGPRRNIVLGLYGACAPLGFFAGFLVGGALPATEARWYFWIASAFAFITAITAYLSVPHDKIDRQRLKLKMDWLGAFLITSGLTLVTYALSVQPYANVSEPERNGFSFGIVYAPFASGVACLLAAFWVEGWYASCPLLPFEFFRPRGVKPLSIACLFFYGSFGVWLYNSAE